MVKDNEKDLTTNTSVNEVIKRRLRKNVFFEELDYSEREIVIKYLKKNKISVPIFGQRGYNLLKKDFFIFEYIITNESSIEYKKEIKCFDNFKEYFEYLSGDIYEQSCYFGYTFSNDEIGHFHIDIEKINYKAFINENIDKYSFEFFQRKKKEETEIKVSEGKRIKNWFDKCGPINTFSELMKKHNEFLILFPLFNEELFYSKLFYSIVFQKEGEAVKEAAIEYCINLGYNYSLFERILLFYGPDAARTVVEKYAGRDVCYQTKRRRIRNMMKTLDFYLSNEWEIERTGGYDNVLQLYYVETKYNDKHNCRQPIAITDYYFSYDEMYNVLGEEIINSVFGNVSIDLKRLENEMKDASPLQQLTFSKYFVEKYFYKGRFIVHQKWEDNNYKVIEENRREFEWFCDFVFYLKNDLSNADLIMCDGIENIGVVPGLKIDNILVRSDVAEKLGIKKKKLPHELLETEEFVETQQNELATANELLVERENDGSYNIEYISDIHLLHRIAVWKCQTKEDVIYHIKLVADKIGNGIKLIGGDIASDFELYSYFIKQLPSSSFSYYFLTLGNHELWPFAGQSLDTIVQKYRDLLCRKGMYLVHNNLYCFSFDSVREITTEELLCMDRNELRERTRDANLVIFGGIGFSGQNNEFNANQGIYRGVIDREREKEESDLFYKIYKKVADYLSDKHVIVLTHMPMKDWAGGDEKERNGFVYVSGHNHRNYYYDDGVKRIYADNQIGYKQKDFSFKHLSIDMEYDWFSDYEDGIYEISRNDYEKFYKGINNDLQFNREFGKLYMLKKEQTYMFLMEKENGSLFTLNGGVIKKTDGHNIDYYYQNLISYATSVKLFLSGYNNYQKKVAQEIRRIGGYGSIHGCIVDIDYYNHLFINPLDGKITAYYALSMTDKDVYKNLASLLKEKCCGLYSNYQMLTSSKCENKLMVIGEEQKISTRKKKVSDTQIYKISRIIKGLQYTTQYNVVRVWNDEFLGDPSEEKGKLIVGNLIDKSITKD